MGIQLGATTYTTVTWTAGDYITEAKLDAMVANDQAYDSHADQGIQLSNNKSFGAKNTTGTGKNLAIINSSNEIEFGESGVSANMQSGLFQESETYTPAGGATATLDCSKGNTHFITMPAGNITIALSNIKVGQWIKVGILQDGVGGRTVTWFTTINWTAPTLTTTASKCDWFAFYCYSAGVYYGFIIDQGL